MADTEKARDNGRKDADRDMEKDDDGDKETKKRDLSAVVTGEEESVKEGEFPTIGNEPKGDVGGHPPV